MDMITGHDMVKAFGVGEERRRVLDGVSVEIGEGEFVAVMGPSGSGKSTLLFALSGMDHLDSGTVSFAGRDLSALDSEELASLRRTQMGFVFQQATLLKNLNLLDNIILPAVRENRKNAQGIIARAKMLMSKTGIAELEKRDITQVSGGQLQRAGICRALMGSPKVIFGDEPTGALNSRSAEEIMDIFTDIHTEGTTVMLVTYDAQVAARTQRILFMRDGSIVSEMRLSKYEGHSMDNRIGAVTAKMREIGI
ncbi:ABC transporter ATP-binding protein [Paenibacillus senegalimassiliensis]|uniref:ABC transporter ATP-binding protein n=1 Tax=Paenibacillus senegalimassiliensis TaxID=1737426 RepID=UPI00073F5222|nr:ABC transporter ATP-binding protein [Paenibacillus senegalimassiliensis]